MSPADGHRVRPYTGARSLAKHGGLWGIGMAGHANNESLRVDCSVTGAGDLAGCVIAQRFVGRSGDYPSPINDNPVRPGATQPRRNR